MLSGLPRWLRAAFASSAGVPLDTEDVRAFLQERIALFGKLGSGIVFAFYLFIHVAHGLRPGDAGGTWTDAEAQLHLANAAVLALVWLACRGRPLSPEALAGVDAAGTFFCCLGAALPVLLPEATPDHKYQMLLVTTNALIARAAVLPTAPSWTLLVSTAAVLPAVVLTWVFHSGRPGEPLRATAFHTVVALLWASVAVAIATVTSRVIYGLRRKVQEARRLGQYTLEEKIGEGGMGEVYRARHALLRRPTAVKLLPPGRSGEHSLRRFEREVQLTSLLTHPNTVSVYDYGRTPDGIFYYAMEYLEGVNLDDLVQQDGPQPAARVVHILRQVCGSLAEAHGVGLIHRDVKPANVMLCERGGVPDVAKVFDFGLVREVHTASPALTSEAALTGTPLFLSPEAIASPESVDARSDLYALGGVAYYLLCGTHVFGGRTLVEVCGHHLHSSPAPLSARTGCELPAGLEDAVMACLEKEPSRRPQSARDLEARLARSDAAGRWSEADARRWWDARVSRPAAGVAHEAATPSQVLSVDLSGRTLPPSL